jgi:hypothetical protein
VAAFSDAGKQLLEDMGPDAIAAALALISGLDHMPPDRSVLCGKEGLLTILVICRRTVPRHLNHFRSFLQGSISRDLTS